LCAVEEKETGFSQLTDGPGERLRAVVPTGACGNIAGNKEIIIVLVGLVEVKGSTTTWNWAIFKPVALIYATANFKSTDSLK
jgi:hypothetical protein